MRILGISAYYHDAAACLLDRGEIVAAAQEERFTRVKHDQRFPGHAIRYCLEAGQTTLDQVDAVVFYEKPFQKFHRLLQTYLSYAPRGLVSFLAAMPVWIKDKLFLKRTICEELRTRFGALPQEILFTEHHEAHAASAFYPSPSGKAVVLCLDGVGEWSTTSAWRGEGSRLDPLWEIRFPHSIGLLYSAITQYTGFKVNSGEYKVMGLAPYGRPVYADLIRQHLIDVKDDGTFRLNLDYFDYCTGLTMVNDRFCRLFGGPPRVPETDLTQKEMDLARSVQDVTEEVMLRLATTLHRETGLDDLCLAGGVALNCVANGRILREGPFKNLWIQPAAGDAGGAVGAALAAWHGFFGQPRPEPAGDAMKGCFLGPSFATGEIAHVLHQKNIPFRILRDDDLFAQVADDLAAEKVVGWFQGRMEFGPRALGARSIIGDARSPRMQAVMNRKIKFRESFRPFAPSVLRERLPDYFDLDADSPYMLLVAPVRRNRCVDMTDEQRARWGIDLLNVPRSDIPAVTHVDYSARVQTVHAATNPRYHRLLKAFEARTGCGVIVNTSFNVRGEPIVCTPEDALRCFLRTDIDTLVLENCVVGKGAGLATQTDRAWMNEFTLD
ncbi:MAG: carbamoyltransferase [Candidatus Riflebacteria bacterium]|nr:carbamoyltransferase [Candidatus Riflebacteria bacterium]